MMRNRATAALLVLALGGPAFPLAAAQAKETSDVAAPAEDAEAAKTSEAGDAAEKKPIALSSDAAAAITNWVIASGDNGDLPFMVIDKVAAEVLVFDAEGQLLGRSAALLGITPGDDSAPGVGDRELSEIKPEDRTTPAGRFVASVGKASGNRRVLWIDYSTAISLHPVVTRKKKERRLQRLKSATAEDNRITYGCINVPPTFYTKVVSPLFKKSAGVVYVLPETKQLTEVFLTFRPQGQSSPLADASR